MTFTLPLPPTTNQMYGYRGSRKYLTRESKQWKEEAQWIYKTQFKKEIIAENVRVVINFYLKRDRDVDNLKLVLDSLEDIVIVNDKQVVALYIMKHKDKKDPRVEVKVETLI